MNTLPEKFPPLVGIFADDLTGALDAAAPFAARGFKTLVSTSHLLADGSVGNKAEVMSVNLGTRRMSPGKIADHTAKVVTAMSALGFRVLVNKIDSTLRGYPGVELLAAMQTLSVDHAVLCPTYPQNGRTVKNGVLLVDGVPVAETDVGRDQLTPLPSSEIDQIVIGSLREAGVEGQVAVIGSRSKEKSPSGRPEILVPDAESEDDLGILARQLASARSTALVAGSAGISVALAKAMGEGRQTVKEDPVPVAGGVFIVTASQRSVLDAQVFNLGLAYPNDLTTVEVSVDRTFEGIDAGSTRQLADAISRGGLALLRLGKLNRSGGPEKANLQKMAGTIVRNLGLAARDVTDCSKPGALVIIGGDTTTGVLSACGVTSIQLDNELQPGTVSGRPFDGSLQGVPLVTRAGGFGDDNSLVELISQLRSGDHV